MLESKKTKDTSFKEDLGVIEIKALFMWQAIIVFRPALKKSSVPNFAKKKMHALFRRCL